jgi:hypothetical protein
MGLLDDAIREHLDLKRRRGADPAEVERAEREALGPVRRAPEPTPIDELSDEPAHETGSAYDHEASAYDQEQHVAQDDEHAAYDREYAGDEDEEHGSWSHDELRADPAHESVAEPHELESDREPDPLEESAEFEPRPHPANSPVSHHAEGQTVEYDVEEAMDHREHGEDEDVLEETPEFLQDTPDHDRLWFEQKPPKDFDFDG